MMGVFWGAPARRFLCHGLLTRLTPVTQSLVAFRAGLIKTTKGKDYATHIQHSSSHQSATSQNQNPFNTVSLHAFKKIIVLARTHDWRRIMKTKNLQLTNISFQFQGTFLLSSYDEQKTCWFYLDDLMEILHIEQGKKTIAAACDPFICRTEDNQLWLNEAGLSFLIFTSDIKDDIQNHLMTRIFEQVIYPFRQGQMGAQS